MCKTCCSRGCVAILGKFTINSTECKQKLHLKRNELRDSALLAEYHLRKQGVKVE